MPFMSHFLGWEGEGGCEDAQEMVHKVGEGETVCEVRGGSKCLQERVCRKGEAGCEGGGGCKDVQERVHEEGRGGDWA
jgi:hypothetical protein